MSKLSPLERYRESLRNAEIVADPAQEMAVLATQDLYEKLLAESSRDASFYQRFKQKISGRQTDKIRGLYFWGGVGRGKTRIGLGTTAGGEAHLACVDAEGKPRITVGTSGIVGAEVPGGPVGDHGGAGGAGAGASARAPAASGAAIALIDEHGATRITLRSTNGDALATFADRDRRVRLSAGTRSDGTVVVPENLGRS